MRGRSSNAKARLRSAGYKCNLCGRRLIDAATLVRHQKNIHNVSQRENRLAFKSKPPQRKLSIKEKDKVFDDLLKEPRHESKPKLRSKTENVRVKMEDASDKKKIVHKHSNEDTNEVKNGESLAVDKDIDKKTGDKVVFECPVCGKGFSVYFNAHKHIQRSHCVNADGRKVGPTSPDLVQPIRVEQCYRCDSRIRSNQLHTCPKTIEEPISVIAEFICSGCNQIFVSLKSFDMHVAGLHNDAVDSMFFPTKLAFMTWRLEMERQTNSKYTLYGEYESKKIYRCNYARNDNTVDKYTAYFCPSSMVVQEFSKGIQVHYYNRHYDHEAYPYTLSSKYKKYSITSFLKSPNEDGAEMASDVGVDEKDLLSQFRKLMDTIVLNAADVNVSVLKILIEKALEMSAVVTDATNSVPATVLRSTRIISDKEIMGELETTTVQKRRNSMDSSEEPKPAKRTRNKSLFTQNESRLSPKILNTFSLASNPNSDEVIPDTEYEHGSSHGIKSNDEGKMRREMDKKTNDTAKINTRLSSFNESLSFNDSYKDFIDKNFIGKTENAMDSDEKLIKNTVKTKLGAFKTSPKRVDRQDFDGVVSKKMKAIMPNRTRSIEASKSTNDTTDPSKSKAHVESNNIVKFKRETKVADSEMNVRVNSKRLSRLVDPLQITITKFRRASSPQMDPVKVTRNTSSPLTDPLELNISKVKSKTANSVEQKNLNTRTVVTPLMDPLEVSTVKIVSEAPKAISPKVYPGAGLPKATSPGVKTPKVPKVTFVDRSISKLSPTVKELKYEVRERENDCNILVLKF